MKILHTADWHLGKRLDAFSRFQEQQMVMNEIVEIAEQHKVDLVIIAGDLFDTFNPTVEALDLFYHTVKRLSNNGKTPVLAIAGNHDSPDRIDAPVPLAKECGIILIGNPNAIVQPFTLDAFEITQSVEGFIEIQLKDFSYPVRILHTPYANEVRLKEYLGAENKEKMLNEVLKETWTQLADEYCDEEGVNLLTAHLFMMKRNGEKLEEPDGEKPIMVGNADMVYTDCIPPQIQYTALGHLHAFRNIQSQEQPVVYSSSPLCYSFSEAGQTKYVSLVEIVPNAVPIYTKEELKNGRPLYRKRFSEVDLAVEWLVKNPYALVELSIETEQFLSSEERKKILQSHDGIIHLIPIVKQIERMETTESTVDLSQNITELFQDYFKSEHKGIAPNEEIMKLFNEIIASK